MLDLRIVTVIKLLLLVGFTLFRVGRTRVASPGSMHDTGCLGLVHWDDPEDSMGREEGGGFRMGNTCIPVADSF